MEQWEEKEAAFEESKTESYASDHYVFHFLPGSLAEKEIMLIAEEQEKCFAKICAMLQTAYPKKIHYYFTTSPLEIGRTLWEEGISCNGVALLGRKESKIYAVYTEAVKCIGAHEDTHMISFMINYPESDFIVEGLAMAMDGLWWGVSNEVWTSYYKNKQPELSIQSMMNNDVFVEQGCEVTYPIAGAFTKYLIDTYEKEKYLALYKYDGSDYEEVFEAVYGKSVAEVEGDFWNQMRAVVFDGEALETMLRAEGY